MTSTPQLHPSTRLHDVLCTAPQPSGSIFIIEKEPKCAPLLAERLELAGLESCVISQWQGEPSAPLPSMLVLVVQDQNVPLKVTWERCRKIREYTNVPISILMSGVEPSEHISNVSLGSGSLSFASPDRSTITTRVSDPIQHSHKIGKRNNIFRRRGALLLDLERHHVKLKGQTLPLTPSEYKILNFLMEWPGRVFRRDELIGVLYREHDAVVPRVVDVHISNLRKKIEPDLSCPTYIQSVRGRGYQFATTSIRRRKKTKR